MRFLLPSPDRFIELPAANKWLLAAVPDAATPEIAGYERAAAIAVVNTGTLTKPKRPSVSA
jgi:hypothetical protein